MIIEVDSGQPVSMDTMIAALRRARIVYIGEHHDALEDHRAQAAITRALLEGGEGYGLGFEMFEARHQSVLSAFFGGELDEEGLLSQVQWSQSWGFEFSFYRPLLEAGRGAGAPLFALNAPRELARSVAREGFAALPPGSRTTLPEMNLADGDHRRLVADALHGHGAMGPERMKHFYEAQVLWDESMAEATSRALSRQQVDRMIVFAGQMHVQGGLGIPNRAARRGAKPYAIVLPMTGEQWRSIREAGAREASSGPVADFIWLTD